jgi:hypothetical protein
LVRRSYALPVPRATLPGCGLGAFGSLFALPDAGRSVPRFSLLASSFSSEFGDLLNSTPPPPLSHSFLSPVSLLPGTDALAVLSWRCSSSSFLLLRCRVSAPPFSSSLFSFLLPSPWFLGFFLGAPSFLAGSPAPPWHSGDARDSMGLRGRPAREGAHGPSHCHVWAGLFGCRLSLAVWLLFLGAAGLGRVGCVWFGWLPACCCRLWVVWLVSGLCFWSRAAVLFRLRCRFTCMSLPCLTG